MNEQIKILDTKIQEFKNKEYYIKEEIENHNNEINELQRKLNIIYHTKSIMEELCELLEKIDSIINIICKI